MNDKYDVAIIGAGIGGLVCGCYLAKAGLKVIIVEQHNKPGGYCTSFERQGYKFDVGVHYLGGVNTGFLGKVLEELNLKDQLKVTQFDPSDKIIMPDNITYVRAKPEDTIEEFKKSFPKETKNIDTFFKFVMQNGFLNIYAKSRGLSFRAFLDKIFQDERLKATLGVLVGNIGTSEYKAAAFPCLILLSQYILDPGYYPEGGMQKFPDILCETIKTLGGDIILSQKVNQIIVNNRKASGIILENGNKIYASMVVSNADARETFSKLLDFPTKELKSVNNMQPTPSMLLLYLGLNINLNKMMKEKCNFGYFSTYNVNRAYCDLERNVSGKKLDWIIGAVPSLHDKISNGNDSLILMIFAPYKSKAFWEENKEGLSEKMIDKFNELRVIPDLRKLIKIKVIGTPQTLQRYTLNTEGSFAGWLPTVEQTERKYLSQNSTVKNLFLAGHWCSTGYIHYGGVPNVAFLGKRASQLIKKEFKKIKT